MYNYIRVSQLKLALIHQTIMDHTNGWFLWRGLVVRCIAYRLWDSRPICPAVSEYRIKPTSPSVIAHKCSNNDVCGLKMTWVSV